MNSKLLIIIIIALLTVAGFWFWRLRSRVSPFSDSNNATQGTVPRGVAKDFKTDFSQASIDLNLLLSGGPGKDAIPALTDPKFVSIEEAETKDETLGVLMHLGGQKRFYPYSIITWHEIVNDEIAGQPVAVTYCPLCGSAIVFDRRVGDEVLTFKVSGLLYESNLVMYDTQTESFWSQGLGESIVGEYLGEVLEIMPMRVIPFSDVKENHPEAQVLSQDTGHFRNYSFNPYSGYEDTEATIFPVSVQNKRFKAKKIMYVVPLGDKSLTFAIDALPEGQVRERRVGERNIRATKVNSEIIVTENNQRVNGFYQMWFSWATLHQDDGVVWEIGKDE